jgi:hypothetical protein
MKKAAELVVVSAEDKYTVSPIVKFVCKEAIECGSWIGAEK